MDFRIRQSKLASRSLLLSSLRHHGTILKERSQKVWNLDLPWALSVFGEDLKRNLHYHIKKALPRLCVVDSPFANFGNCEFQFNLSTFQENCVIVN